MPIYPYQSKPKILHFRLWSSGADPKGIGLHPQKTKKKKGGEILSPALDELRAEFFCCTSQIVTKKVVHKIYPISKFRALVHNFFVVN